MRNNISKSNKIPFRSEFLIVDKVLSNVKSNIELPKLKNKTKKFNETVLSKDFREIDWPVITRTDTDTQFLIIINNLIEKCAFWKG